LEAAIRKKKIDEESIHHPVGEKKRKGALGKGRGDAFPPSFVTQLEKGGGA